jgi:uncharacterized protein YjbI with pentapeptide repeats
MQDLFTGVRGRDVLRSSLSPVYLSGSPLVGANLTGADLRDATLDKAVFQWADLYQANIATAELQRLASTGALIGGHDARRLSTLSGPATGGSRVQEAPGKRTGAEGARLGRLELACWSSRLVYAEELS